VRIVANLRCESVVKSYGGVRALNGVSVDLPGSGIVAVVGPNGAGKTTLLGVLTGSLRPDSGRCYLGDRDITGLAPWRIARLGIARTFQELRLVRQVSVLENMLVALPGRRGESLLYAVSRVGLGIEERESRTSSMALLKFVGLDMKATELAGELSYGQQKLLALACCLATQAPILLLDEPVAGVHPEMVTQILGRLVHLRQQGKLIVFVEHDLAAVREVADSVVVMDDGEVIAQGVPEEVLDRRDVMEAYIA
jgi:ABC-type branched-subunit amino acid transport system ATPase component